MGSCSSAACHAAHYGLAAGTGLLGGMTQGGMASLSVVFLGASYGLWYRFLGGRCRPVREQVGAFIVQAGISLAVFSGTQAMALHTHMNNEKVQWFQSLPDVLREDMLRQTRITYSALPPDLRTRLDNAAQRENIPPEVFIITCSGTDPVSQKITAFLSEQKRKQCNNPIPNSYESHLCQNL